VVLRTRLSHVRRIQSASGVDCRHRGMFGGLRRQPLRDRDPSTQRRRHAAVLAVGRWSARRR